MAAKKERHRVAAVPMQASLAEEEETSSSRLGPVAAAPIVEEKETATTLPPQPDPFPPTTKVTALRPSVHNVVATAQIETSSQLDLDRLNHILRFSSFNRKKFAAVTLRLARPNCTILLFTSGKLVITGSKSASEALLSAYSVCRILRARCAGQRFRLVGFEIQNIVAHSELNLEPGEMLDIERLYERHHIFSTYQRHIFPGLIFRHPSVEVVVLMFFSGKIVLTGARKVDDIEHGWRMALDLMRPYVARRQ